MKEGTPAKPAPSKTAKKGKKKKDEEKDEQSPEDKKLQATLNLYVTRAGDADEGIQKNALEALRTTIKESTSSMTSIPKPLKYLAPRYDDLSDLFASGKISGANKALLADVLSVLAMTLDKEEERESLRYKLAGDVDSVGAWGHEYVRNLAGEIGLEYDARLEKDPEADVSDILALVDKIIPFNMEHNAEPDACDLLMEVDQLAKIVDFAVEDNFQRICLYLISCSQYVPEPEDLDMLRLTYQIYVKVGQTPDALRLAIKLNDSTLIKKTFDDCKDPLLKKQLGYMLAQNNLFIYEDEETPEEEILTRIVSNRDQSGFFLELAKDLEVMEPKEPKDVYKKHLVETRGSSSAVAESASQNLAETFVNAFVNAGFGTDKKMTADGNAWIYRNKEHGMMCAAASLGMIYLWDSDGGCNEIDKYTYSENLHIKAGALLGVGICNSRVRNSFETAMGILSDSVEKGTPEIQRLGAILGLGIAYAGTNREELFELLNPVFDDATATIEVTSVTALALGLIFAGSGNTDVTEPILGVFLEGSKDLTTSIARYLSLGLGLVLLKKQELCEVSLATLKVLEADEDEAVAEVGKYASTTVETCAYAGTGNVLKIQKLLTQCDDHLKEDNSTQQVAVLGIALIAMGEDLGTKMALRAFNHLLQYGELNIRRAVPLALGLLHISYPEFAVMDTLSKLTHDHDAAVAQSAILGLGLIGAGTNNARAANMLRQLSAYYYKDATQLFMVNLAQGLLHAGKGTVTFDPISSNRLLLSSVGIAGLLPVLHGALDVSKLLVGKPYLLYTLASSMRPRMMMTLDVDLKPLTVPVRVGQAVDTVGQAGKPKTITGFQTHETPVLLSHGDRAELATDEYEAISSVLEGFIILKKKEKKLKGKGKKEAAK